MRKFLLIVALLVAPAAAAAQSQFTRINAPGPHAAGFRIVEQYDLSRGYRGTTDPYSGKINAGERARPVQTLIWYPAEQGTGHAMKARDYLRLGGTADIFPHSATERARLVESFIHGSIGGLKSERASAELAAPMLALRDAAASAGKFPVVIYAPSYRAPAFENADLCEYLASLGFVVIASPSIGQSPEGMTDTLEGAEAQADDIRFLIGYAHRLPEADTGQIAVMGYSWGGLANVMAAAQDSRIDALVSLDGSVRSFPDVIEQSRYLTAQRITAPMLYVAATPRHIEDLPADMNQERSFLNKMVYADLYRVTLAPYVHGNFAVMMGQRFRPDGSAGNYDRDELSAANAWLETYVRHFLNAYLKGDAAGRAFLHLSAGETGAPAHLFTVYRRSAQGIPANRAAFAAELARRNFEQAPAIYRAMQKSDPGFALSEAELNALGISPDEGWRSPRLRRHPATQCRASSGQLECVRQSRGSAPERRQDPPGGRSLSPVAGPQSRQ